MNERQAIILKVDGDVSGLDGRTFQAHVMPDGRLRLYLVTIPSHYELSRCPVRIAGERCGLEVGHDGKHMWANGD